MSIENPNWALLKFAADTINRERLAKRESVREAVKLASVPMPANIVSEIALLNAEDARNVLRDHPGYDLSEKLKSYKASLRVFEQSVTDLLQAIAELQNLALDGKIIERIGGSDLDQVKGKIQKELLAVSNAAHSLVEHSARRLQKDVQVAGYEEQRQQSFGTDGLHEFVIGLRNVLGHFHVIPISWQAQFQVDAEYHRTEVKLDRDEVLFVFTRSKASGTAAARQFLSRSPTKIDLKSVFEDYRNRTKKFHLWFSEKIEVTPQEALSDYVRCLSANKHAAFRTFWKAMVGNWLSWTRPPNAFRHLRERLSADQFETVVKLPKGSPEQVDEIIEFLDPEGACDEELRQLAYRYFKRCVQLDEPNAA